MLDDCEKEETMLLVMVDEIPSDCGRRSTGSRKRRRPTLLTQRTCPLSDEEEDDDGDVLSLNVVAISDVTSEEDDISSTIVEEEDTSSGSMMSLMDLSVENAFRSNSCQLLSLLEQNHKALYSLLQEEEEDDVLFQNCLEEPQEDTHDVGFPLSVAPHATATPKAECWKDSLDFELQHSVPGVMALALYCAAHASTYELISNLAYEAVEPELDGFNKGYLYGPLLILGCLLSRYCGLVWDFVSPMAYRRVKWIYHNRVRCGSTDAKALHWLQQQGEVALGCVQIVAYYMCYIGVVFFVGELAGLCDQRDEILAGMPSSRYEESLSANYSSTSNHTFLYMCPAEDMSPQGLFGPTNATAHQWDPLACNYEMGVIVESFGSEDDLYFFDSLSRNSYDHFFGQYYEAPLFDSVHHILFYAGVALIAMVALKKGLGYSFWAGW
ncbi:expressed unknown protein [Seminavis robusta]|uniref:Uncharacterized protein n=1 Tax=Seminavis robusta TaxID=568900 RepID=A0A9N8DFL0_9STRA|nr:expressed unknown protein [Seminavis robusta]|eukprot:Sro68_g038340.1 n/a (439) ;mRNA; f:124255-125571